MGSRDDVDSGLRSFQTTQKSPDEVAVGRERYASLNGIKHVSFSYLQVAALRTQYVRRKSATREPLTKVGLVAPARHTVGHSPHLLDVASGCGHLILQ
jgi:hypothetical protein